MTFDMGEFFAAWLIGCGACFVIWIAACRIINKLSDGFPKITDESGQDIAEYAMLLAIVVVLAIGGVRLIGSNASNVFSQVASAIQ